MQNEEEKPLHIWVITDVHDELKYMNKLVEYCKNKAFTPDYIFGLGDFVTWTRKGHRDPEEVKKKFELCKQYFAIIEQISPNFIYVPGNHDPNNLFDNNPEKISENSINIHKQALEIRKGLTVIGVGGSISNPITEEEFFHRYDIKNYNKMIWKAFPYINNEENPDYYECDKLFKADWDVVFDKIKDYDGEVIVLTHNGPFTGWTSNAWENNKAIYGGSKALDLLLQQNKDKVWCNMHGHSHGGVGLGKILNMSIFNPGAMKYGCFGIAEITKYKNIGWRVNSFKLLDLDFK